MVGGCEWSEADMQYLAAEEKLDANTCGINVHWCAGFSNPRTSSEARELVWSDIAKSSTVMVPDSPMAAWRHCTSNDSIITKALNLVNYRIGEPPRVGTAPLLRVCLGPAGAGKTHCMEHFDMQYPFGRVFDDVDGTDGLGYGQLMGYTDIPSKPSPAQTITIGSRIDPRDWWELSEHQWNLFQKRVDVVHLHYKTSTEYRTVVFDRGTHSKMPPMLQYLSAFPSDSHRDMRYGREEKPWMVPMEDSEDEQADDEMEEYTIL